MSADPTPLTDEEIAELERQDHAPDRRLLATIRQRTQERDEAVHERIDRGARLIIAERQRDEAVQECEAATLQLVLCHRQRDDAKRQYDLSANEAVALLVDVEKYDHKFISTGWMARRAAFLAALGADPPG